MNRFFLLCVLCVGLAACGLVDDEREEESKTIYIHIPDEAFLRYCLEHFDDDGNGRISLYEARRIRRMDCSGLGIASLQGIEEFAFLQRLDCSDNDLMELDVRRLADLQTLDADRNAHLSVLKVDGLRSLYRLGCGGCALAELYLGGDGSLAWIDCRANRLTTLDVSACASRMEALLATGNPDLAVVYVGHAQGFDTLSLDAGTSVEAL